VRHTIKRFFSIITASIVIFAIQAATAQAAIADVSRKDVQTIVRTVGFLENKEVAETVKAKFKPIFLMMVTVI
jgi:hypothetical protein